MRRPHRVLYSRRRFVVVVCSCKKQKVMILLAAGVVCKGKNPAARGLCSLKFQLPSIVSKHLRWGKFGKSPPKTCATYNHREEKRDLGVRLKHHTPSVLIFCIIITSALMIVHRTSTTVDRCGVYTLLVYYAAAQKVKAQTAKPNGVVMLLPACGAQAPLSHPLMLVLLLI